MPPSTAHANTSAGLPVRYPTILIDTRGSLGAQRLLLRPVLPQDAHQLSTLLQAQSAPARRNRFHSAIRPSPAWGQRMSQVDYRQQLALVVCSVAGGVEQLVADARYGVAADGQSAEMALMVDERWQRQGIGRWLLLALQQAAADAGLAWLEGEVLRDNHAMLGLARGCGFAITPAPHDEPVVRVRRHLAAAGTDEALAIRAQRPSGSLQRLRQRLGLAWGLGSGLGSGLWPAPARSPHAQAPARRPH